MQPTRSKVTTSHQLRVMKIIINSTPFPVFSVNIKEREKELFMGSKPIMQQPRLHTRHKCWDVEQNEV